MIDAWDNSREAMRDANKIIAADVAISTVERSIVLQRTVSIVFFVFFAAASWHLFSSTSATWVLAWNRALKRKKAHALTESELNQYSKVSSVS